MGGFFRLHQMGPSDLKVILPDERTDRRTDARTMSLRELDFILFYVAFCQKIRQFLPTHPHQTASVRKLKNPTVLPSPSMRKLETGQTEIRQNQKDFGPLQLVASGSKLKNSVRNCQKAGKRQPPPLTQEMDS